MRMRTRRRRRRRRRSLERLLHLQRGPHGPLGVVLVGDRRAEQGHDGVADDLVDPAAEAGDVGGQPLEAAVDQVLDLLGVAASRHSAVNPTRSANSTVTTRRSSAGPQGVPADRAEPGPVGHHGRARRAPHRARILARPSSSRRTAGSPPGRTPLRVADAVPRCPSDLCVRDSPLEGDRARRGHSRAAPPVHPWKVRQ